MNSRVRHIKWRTLFLGRAHVIGHDFFGAGFLERNFQMIAIAAFDAAIAEFLMEDAIAGFEASIFRGRFGGDDVIGLRIGAVFLLGGFQIITA